MNGDGGLDGAGMRTGVEANEGTQYRNGDGAGTGTGMGTRGRTQDGNGDGSRDGDESSSSGDENGHENGYRDGNVDTMGEVKGEASKRNKPQQSCRRDQALSFRTRHHLCRQRVALEGLSCSVCKARYLYTRIAPRG